MCYQKLIQKVGIDKVAHFSVSGLLVFAFDKFLPIWASLSVVAILGIAKEAYDAKKGGKMEIKDILADLLGIAAAALIILI